MGVNRDQGQDMWLQQGEVLAGEVQDPNVVFEALHRPLSLREIVWLNLRQGDYRHAAGLMLEAVGLGVDAPKEAQPRPTTETNS